jgi:protein-S-isoprenylcysteine O-methyltransferase Ste14
MSDWGIVLLGAPSFLIALGVDAAALAELRGAKQPAGLLSAGLMGYALMRAAQARPKLALPAALVWLGWPLLLAATALLFYSLLLEISFRRTYVEAGASSTLVRTGTYALTRHPGVLWFALLLVALLLVSRSRLLLWAGPIWLGLDVLAVYIQDCFSLPRQFPDYAEYRQQTPMLIPTRESIVRCLRTLRIRGRKEKSLPNPERRWEG